MPILQSIGPCLGVWALFTNNIGVFQFIIQSSRLCLLLQLRGLINEWHCLCHCVPCLSHWLIGGCVACLLLCTQLSKEDFLLLDKLLAPRLQFLRADHMCGGDDGLSLQSPSECPFQCRLGRASGIGLYVVEDLMLVCRWVSKLLQILGTWEGGCLPITIDMGTELGPPPPIVQTPHIMLKLWLGSCFLGFTGIECSSWPSGSMLYEWSQLYGRGFIRVQLQCNPHRPVMNYGNKGLQIGKWWSICTHYQILMNNL